jgi:cation diffusion facilitator CzcD-associated flavoprotein CzcO
MAIDEDQTSNPSPSYSRFACIGSGFSAIGLGATLQRWYGIDDVRFFERHSQLGGTWFVNQYPGMAPPARETLWL